MITRRHSLDDPRVKRTGSSALLIFAGVFAFHYAHEPGHTWSLLIYALCLSAAALELRRLAFFEAIDTTEKSTMLDECDASRTSPMCENTGLAGKPAQSFQADAQATTSAAVMIQQDLDLDGTGALRSLDVVTGEWLVSEASEPAAKLVRFACIKQVIGGESEMARVDRWFDIAVSLRSRECRALPKAELRRAYVADHRGVSKEQVRQIDQGRYAPLNKLLRALDPSTL